MQMVADDSMQFVATIIGGFSTAHRCPASLAARDLPLRTNYRAPASEITTHGAADYPTEAMVRTGALLKPLRGAHGAFCGENRSKSYVEGCSYPKKRLLRILTARSADWRLLSLPN